MLKKVYSIGIVYPKSIIAITVVVTLLLASQLSSIRWETDARVYLPKGHPAILYDEKVDGIFGVRDTVIIGIVNDQTIFNKDSLARIQRITQKIASLDGVMAVRDIDVISLSTATFFAGSETEIGAIPIMDKLPENQQDIDEIKRRVFDNADLFVGNIVSTDGKGAMIRAKLKEGIANRYMTYFQIKGILAAESGDESAWPSGQWNANGQPSWQKWNTESPDNPTTGAEQSSNPWWDGQETEGWDAADNGWQSAELDLKKNASAPENSSDVISSDANADSQTTQKQQQAEVDDQSYDKFYLAGRPVIEVSSGLYAMEDLKLMVPLVLVVMAIVLLMVFKTLSGVFLPILVMVTAIIWTFGVMVLFDVPMYTISTMLPVILIAVGIGDAIHLLSYYYDNVLEDPHRPSHEIVSDTVQRLGPPLITTSVTTAIGFMALTFAEMPPFKIFGLFAVLGILFSWLISITLLPAILVLLKPKVGAYHARRRAMRVYHEQSRLSSLLTHMGVVIGKNQRLAVSLLAILIVVAFFGGTRLFVDSSWLSDFKEESEVALSNKLLNEKFSGTVFLNIIVEADRKDALKDPRLLSQMEALQSHVETLPYVGGSLSVVNFLRSMNTALHEGDKAYDVLPDSQQQIAEFLYLFSVSGRPQQLDQVVDYEYKKGLISVAIKTDHTRELKKIIDSVTQFVEEHFQDLTVDVNFAGSANNSYVWAELLIDSQVTAILFSKLGIFIIASLIMLSFIAGVYIVVPVVLSTLLVAGVAGWLQIPLDVSTALAAGIAIGVGVDYAVHYIFRYMSERREHKNHDEATAATLRTAGRTIVLNATVVTASFSVLIFSQFPPHAKLGYFVASYMVVSCLIAIIVLPILFSYFKPRFVEPKAKGT